MDDENRRCAVVRRAMTMSPATGHVPTVKSFHAAQRGVFGAIHCWKCKSRHIPSTVTAFVMLSVAADAVNARVQVQPGISSKEPFFVSCA